MKEYENLDEFEHNDVVYIDDEVDNEVDDLEEDFEDEEKEVSFEESLEELEDIVNKLESGDIPLDDAIEKFNRAMILVKTCEDKLKNAEEAITKIVKDNGDVVDYNKDD